MRRTHLTVAAALIFTLLTLGACSRSRTGEGTTAEPGQLEEAPGSGQPLDFEPRRGPSPDDGAVPMRLTDQGRARSAQPSVTPADPRDTAFETGRLTAVALHARDTVLGALGTGLAVSARDRAILASCQALLVPLLSGELATGAISDRMGPGGRALLDDLIWAADTLSEVRLGLVTSLTEREAAVPFRLVGETRFATGEVILESLEDRWYTADVQVEFSSRDMTSRFNPGAVRSNPGS